MSVLVDTGLFVAHQNSRDAHHHDATRAMDALLAGRFGRAFTTDYVFDEAVTFTRAKSRSHAEAMALANRILGRREYPKVFDLVMVLGSTFRHALRIFEDYDDQGLSFTDATTVAAMQRYAIQSVLSFDDDFDGLVMRIDPRRVGE